jgi:hypothetical protein
MLAGGRDLAAKAGDVGRMEPPLRVLERRERVEQGTARSRERVLKGAGHARAACRSLARNPARFQDRRSPPTVPGVPPGA